MILLLCLIGIGSVEAQKDYKTYSYIVKAAYPHSTSSYTQGLQIVDGVMYENTGLYGESRLMRVDIKTGKGETIYALPKEHFGEGITILGDTIYTLTWREGVVHFVNRKSGALINKIRYSGEGWGLTSDGDRLYMSDGSSKITIRDRVSFAPISSHMVTFNGRPVEYLNEMEWIDGKIWANIYTTNQIVIIDPKTWRVEGVIDLMGLLPIGEWMPDTDVLNGIAYDEASGKIYVTGKNWSKLFEIEIVER